MSRFNLVITMPVYNDMEVAELLIQKLDRVLDANLINTKVILIDDGSTETINSDFLKILQSITSVEIIRLRRNLGHQRAIAVGLTYIYEQKPCDAVLVMDADGEDKPEDVPRLIQRFIECEGKKIIFAARIRRTESIIFKIFYKLYQALHWLLIGIWIKIGNFSIIPFNQLSTLAVVSELWNHYAAAVYRCRIPYETLPTDRGYRLSGKSKMNFVALVTHGLSAISVYSETVGTRILVAFSFVCFFLLIFFVLMMVIWFITNASVLNKIIYLTGFLLILLLQIVGGCFLVAFFLLSNRNSLSFIPLRDYGYFIESIKKL